MTGSLEPVAIQFMLEHLQESIRQSGISFVLWQSNYATDCIKEPEFHPLMQEVINLHMS